jgi:alanyl-tRNA synthetase
MLETTPEALVEKVQSLQAGLDEARRRAGALEKELALKDVSSFLSQVREADGVKMLAARVKSTRPDNLRDLADALRDKLGSAVIVLGTVSDDKPYFVVSVTPDLVARGYHAGNIIREAARITGGGGGGKPNLAQGGGKDPSKLDEALAAVPGLIRLKQ